jgi:ferritin
MLKKSIEKAFNDQINAEMFSSYLYLSMSAWCEKNNLPGFGHWMRAQAREEYAHAMKFYRYIAECGGAVKLAAIAGPKTEWKDIAAIFAETLKHEQHITRQIHTLVELAAKEKDYAAGQFLQWFVSEQVEEEGSAEQIIAKLEMIGKQGPAMYMLDKEMAARGAA